MPPVQQQQRQQLQQQHQAEAEADAPGIVLSSLSAPRPDAPSMVYNWSAATFLHQPAKKGDVLLLLRDCVGVAAGRRLRVGTGSASEEEGVVATLACPAPGLGPENPRDALGASMGASASPAGTALLPAGASVERRGELFVPASMQLSTGKVEVPHTSAVGVAQLSFALLHDHAGGASVMQYPAARPLPPLCPGGPGIGGPLCSGHGACDERTGACACAAGRNGTACELQLCEASCSGRGGCRNGTCDCAAGWAAPACATRSCVAECSGHGTCGADGTCGCEAGWSGPAGAPCSVQGAGCPNGCSHHGRCVQGNCACHNGYVGRDCAQPLMDLLSACPAGCSGNGLCAGGKCRCFGGYYGAECVDFCPHNCSFHGRCSVAFDCICHTGYGAPDCSVECPNRCSGHGDCDDGACSCIDGYEGADCSSIVGVTLDTVLVGGLSLELPLVLVVLTTLFLLVVCFVVQHIRNLCAGKYGLGAIPLYDFFMKKWRNAPTFEPVYVTQSGYR